MEIHELTCIVCPVGCRIRVEDENGDLRISGNGCPRGERYARQEISNPVRTVTSAVAVRGAAIPLCPVKTASPVPKASIPACLAEIREIRIDAPVAVGDVVKEDLAGPGVALMATDNRPLA